jgi:hypothetical protein
MRGSALKEPPLSRLLAFKIFRLFIFDNYELRRSLSIVRVRYSAAVHAKLCLSTYRADCLARLSVAVGSSKSALHLCPMFIHCHGKGLDRRYRFRFSFVLCNRGSTPTCLFILRSGLDDTSHVQGISSFLSVYLVTPSFARHCRALA